MNENEIDEDADWTDDQFDYTEEIATPFVNEVILPALVKFDFDRDDENYVPGVATYGLFVRLADILTDIGYTVDDLKQMLDENQTSDGQTLH